MPAAPSRTRPIALVAASTPGAPAIEAALSARCAVTAVPEGDLLVAAGSSAPDLVVIGATATSEGIPLLRRLRADPRTRHAVVIVVTEPRGGDDIERARIEYLEAGADDCLSSPFSTAELIARAERHLQRSHGMPGDTLEQHYRALFDAMQEGLLLVERVAGTAPDLPDFRYLDINPAAERILGITRDRMVGRTAREVNPMVDEGVIRTCVEVMETGVPQRREVYTRLADQHHASVFFRPAPHQVAVLFWDITERKRTADALAETADTLRRERERLALALRTGQMGVYEWRIGETTVWWSPEVYPLYGVDAATFTPTVDALAALVHPEDREELWRKTTEFIATHETFDHEYRVVRPDGEVRYIANRSHIGLDAEGKVERVTGVALDVTERRHAEHRLSVLISSFDDHLVAYDRQWRYTFVNAAAARTLGVPREELLGKSIWELYPGAVGNQYYHNVHAALHEQRVIHDEHYYAPFDKWFENHIYPSPTGVTVFSTDITARKRTEAALHASEEALREADRRKDEFLAMLAHELRNPLAAIRNAVEILVQTEGEVRTARRVSGILDRQVRHMVRQVDDLLDVSRISRGRIELRTEQVDLAEVVRDALEGARPLGEQLEHDLVVRMPPGPIWVVADPVRLAQVVGNLLNNAHKFTERGGRVELSVARVEDRVELRVRDTGVGIAADQLERIFDMFTQVDTSLERTRGGLGLGLTLVKKLVEMHGGTVEAHSAGVGQGSEFVVRLPAR